MWSELHVMRRRAAPRRAAPRRHHFRHRVYLGWFWLIRCHFLVFYWQMTSSHHIDTNDWHDAMKNARNSPTWQTIVYLILANPSLAAYHVHVMCLLADTAIFICTSDLRTSSLYQFLCRLYLASVRRVIARCLHCRNYQSDVHIHISLTRVLEVDNQFSRNSHAMTSCDDVSDCLLMAAQTRDSPVNITRCI